MFKFPQKGFFTVFPDVESDFRELQSDSEPENKESKEVISTLNIALEFDEEDSFHEVCISRDRKTHISQTDLEVFATSTFDVRMRMTPLEDVTDLSEKLNQL